MPSPAPVFDFRHYRPAAVVAIDLVKHSTKERIAGAQARAVLERVLARHLAALGVADVRFNFTGDGYVCAFLGDASSRLIDVLNCAIPDLLNDLRLYDQAFRCGVDFGLVHLAQNTLTGSPEHFDLPGIQAARLEHVANPNEVLTTETVRNLFAPLYPQAFSDVRVVQTKDREIRCHTLTPIDFESIRRTVRTKLFEPTPEPSCPDEQRSILIVEDNLLNRELTKHLASARFPDLVAVEDGRDALLQLESRRFDLALMDVDLPFIDGHQVMETLFQRGIDTAVIVISGLPGHQVEMRTYQLGASLFLRKPVRNDELLFAIERCLSGQSPSSLRGALALLNDDATSVLNVMWKVAYGYRRITRRPERDAATNLLRHKAKSVADELLSRIQPGADLAGILESCRVQLDSLNRLCDVVERARVVDVVAYLKGLASDYSTLYPQLKLTIDNRTSDVLEVEHMPLLTLAVCELIDNAVAAMESRGKVDVSVSPLPAVGMLHLRVSDSGPGVAESLRGSLFDAGASTRGAGHGLGLSLVREAVGRLQGTVQYEYDSGAVFTIVIPWRGAGVSQGV